MLAQEWDLPLNKPDLGQVACVPDFLVSVIFEWNYKSLSFLRRLCENKIMHVIIIIIFF